MSERKSISRVVVKHNRELFSERELEEIESARATNDTDLDHANLLKQAQDDSLQQQKRQ